MIIESAPILESATFPLKENFYEEDCTCGFRRFARRLCHGH
jgi:hypothetical protein